MTKGIAGPGGIRLPAIIALISFVALLYPRGVTAQTAVTIQADKPGIAISPHLWGIFFEDINWAADGGIYGELVQNRSFEYINMFGSNFTPTTAWTLVQRGGAAAAMAVQTANPLNNANPHYLSLTVSNGGSGAGVSNAGFAGIPVIKGDTYRFSFWARRISGAADTFSIRIENAGGAPYGSATIRGITTAWAKYRADLTSDATDNDARLLVLTTGTGRVDMDMISLFPAKTYKNRDNGLRADLVKRLADLRPRFIRFPGGCVVHSSTLATAYRWKDAIGPVETRKTIPNLWGYMQSRGLGYYEFFQLCEDLGAEPLPVLPVGVSCHFKSPYQVVPMDSMQPWVDDALDLIEWANGPATSVWGAKRAAAGHPEPFKLKFIGVGNEEWGPEFKQRSDLFVAAIRKKYPDIKIVGTAGPNVSSADYFDLWQYNKTAKTDLVDEHYYMDTAWFRQNTHRYDTFSRTGPNVFAGEYASGPSWLQPKIQRTLGNAVAEAAFMTGLERNGDVVLLSCYAPLFRHAQCNGAPAQQPWEPNLIYFNNHASYGTPSYYAQLLFSNNTGQVLLPIDYGGPAPTKGPVYYAASNDTGTGDIILKAVNITAMTIVTEIRIQGAPGLQPGGAKIVLSSANNADTNGFAQPEKVAPVTSKLDSVSPSFKCRFAPNSITVLRLPTRPPAAVGGGPAATFDNTARLMVRMSRGVRGGSVLALSWYLNEQSVVSAHLYDCRGAMIANVIPRQRFERGERRFVWESPGGLPLARGIYIVSLSVDKKRIAAPCAVSW